MNKSAGFTRTFLRLTEPLVFGGRRLTLTVVVFATLFFAWHAAHLERSAGYDKQLPEHDYTQLFRKYQAIFGGSTRVLVALKQKEGDIYDSAFLEALRKATDDVFFLPGIHRGGVSSLFTPNVIYAEPKEGGVLATGTVVPADYIATREMAQVIRANVRKSGSAGRLVSADQRGALIWAELLEIDPQTGGKLDYLAVARHLEDVRGRVMQPRLREYRLRADRAPLVAGTVVARHYRELPRFERDGPFALTYNDDLGLSQTEPIGRDSLEVFDLPNPDYQANITVHINGFAKATGDVADAAREVVGFFGLALLLTLALLWLYCGSLRVALLPLGCALVAVVWELGLLRLFGFGLDPYAILVPFLILALGVSHGVQITNFWLTGIADHGLDQHAASLATFRRLVVPGLTALLTNIAGFATLALVPIQFVREMAWNACFGCVGIIVAKKVLLPILLSYAPVPHLERFRARQQRRDKAFDRLWTVLSGLTARRHAVPVLLLAGGLATWSVWQAQSLTIGELRSDVAELRPDARYNLDAAVIDSDFIGHRDAVLSVMAETHAQACIDHRVMEAIDDFAWYMSNAAGVQTVRSLPQAAARINAVLFETNPKWHVLPRNQYLLAQATAFAGPGSGLSNEDCSVMPVNIRLRDHRAQTIEAVIAAVKVYDAGEAAPVRFTLASGNAGLLAASNEVVRSTERSILFWVYAAIALCVWLSFRSFASVACILLPLALVSVLAYAVMAVLDIGLKATTLPIAAFAAGIGVDYGIYIYSVLQERIAGGDALREAYRQTLHQTGKAVIFTGLALSGGVATWIFSGLQFQADMGLLLALMFLANMMGAAVLLPAIAALVLRPPSSNLRMG